MRPAPVTRIAGALPDAARVVPATPASLDGADATCPEATRALLDAARRLGTPLGYAREQRGRLVQDIFPIRRLATEQVSSSSAVQLGLHTETAFHPWPPRWVVLLCLRGDPGAATVWADVDEAVAAMDPRHVATLGEPTFRSEIDPSFCLDGGAPVLTDVVPLVRTGDGWRLTFDRLGTRATDARGAEALEALGLALEAHVRSVVLASGDLLVIDNHRAVHGRAPFRARWDGTDRWLRRALVFDDLPPADQLDGHVITTRFDAPLGVG
ncbi:MAG: hypothetical protein RL283_1389 [Actinomycetota bacterium]|jgi:hypothetical protein